MNEPEDTNEVLSLSERPFIFMEVGLIVADASYLDIIYFRTDLMISPEQMIPFEDPQFPFRELIDFAIMPTLGDSPRQKRLIEDRPKRLREKMKAVQHPNFRGQIPSRQRKRWGNYRA